MMFLKPTAKRCNISSVSYSKNNIHVSDYTGEEPGGFWTTPPSANPEITNELLQQQKKMKRNEKTEKTTIKRIAAMAAGDDCQLQAATFGAQLSLPQSVHPHQLQQQNQQQPLNLQWLEATNAAASSVNYANATMQHPFVDLQSSTIAIQYNSQPAIVAVSAPTTMSSSTIVNFSHANNSSLEHQQPSVFRML